MLPAVTGPRQGAVIPADIAYRVTADRAAHLYSFGAGSLAITTCTSIGAVFMVGHRGIWPALLAWLAALLLVQLMRGIDLTFIYPSRRRLGCREVDITRFGLGTLLSGFVWGCFPLLFLPVLDTTHRCLALVILTAMVGGAIAPLSASLATGAGFFALMLLPTAYMMLSSPVHAEEILGGLTVLMLASVTLSSKLMSHSVVRGFELHRLNEGLMQAAEAQRCQSEAVNAQLSAAQIALHEANLSLEKRIEMRTAELEREIRDRKTYAEALARLASTDPLTGLCNRNTFAERLACMLAAAENMRGACAVLFLDLDNFKQINDVRGHATGDQVLQAVSGLLSTRAGEHAEIARWGGDEFVLAMPIEPGSPAALTLGQDLRRVLAMPLQVGLEVVRVDVTVGIAIFPEHGRTQDELIRAADVAMYHAKKEGRGRVTLFDRDLADGMSERHMLEQALRAAVERSELSLVFQPIVSAKTGRCEAFESLVRWNHPTRGPISPGDFIPVAEQSGQIGQIGRWVLKEACRAAATWPAGPHGAGPPPVTVNVSVAQVVSGTLLADVEAALLGADLPSTRLQLEITESMFVSDHVRVTPVFDELRRRGVRILLDDFGTGFSSLAYLGKLPIDVIKIDQSFVRSAERDGFAIINAILSIARALSLQVTAEGVETPLQRTVLASIGVERLQGFLIARPMPGENVAGWLAAQAHVVPEAAVA